MKTILSGFFISLVSISSVFAINAPTNFSAEPSSPTSAELSWDMMEDAAAYSIYYSTTSWDLSEYDLIETGPHTLINLQENTTYYVALTANDENFEESEKTAEISFTTGGTWFVTVSNFALDSVEMLSSTKLKLTFNADLDNTEEAIREFKIANKFDDLEELAITGSEIDQQDAKSLIVTLASPAPTSAQYNVTIVRLNDSEGNNIANGVDGVDSFSTPDSYEAITTTQEPVPETLSSAGPEEANNEVSGGSSWKNLSDEDLAKTASSVAKTAENLPTTGAEHWFLWILALILGAIIFRYKTT